MSVTSAVALLPESSVALTAGGNASDARWATLEGARVKERLAFDHAELLKAARSLEKKAFRTRILATDLLEELPLMREGRSRPAQLFRWRHRRKPVFFCENV
jgi:8-oxo-dGTP diphosphatase